MKYLTIKEKQYPILFGMGAMILYEKISGKNGLKMFLDGGLEDLSFTDSLQITYCGLVNGSQQAGNEIDFTEDDVMDILQDDFDPIMRTVIAELVDSYPGVKKKKPKRNPQKK